MRVGIVGYGNLGKYLTQKVLDHEDLELAFVWNRSLGVFSDFPKKECVLDNLSDFSSRKADLIIEVCHPDVTKEWGVQFLEHANFMIGSPTAMSDQTFATNIRVVAMKGPFGLFVPSGALWGAQDIKKMADRGTLSALKVTMKKHPKSFKLNGHLETLNKSVKQKAVVLYDGPVRDLCPLAPNNVNTMAAAAIAAHNLGFDNVLGCLISDPSLEESHVVQVDVLGPGDISTGNAFHVKTIRHNPAAVGAVTGSATYDSFFSSMLAAFNRGPGIHMC